jgi:NAD(P)-dependent dehydrogenase (short-subunit alcohol dehydrogenase family)
VGALFLQKYGESQEVIEAASKHHNENLHGVNPITVIVQTANVLSNFRPGARKEFLEKAIDRLRDMEAAVEAMTKVWAKELGAFGIRSMAIAPGFMDTSGTHNALEEKMLSKWIDKTPLRRTGNIQEVVSTVQFVIENDFVNGEIINVNGGLTI